MAYWAQGYWASRYWAAGYWAEEAVADPGPARRRRISWATESGGLRRHLDMMLILVVPFLV